MTIETAELKKLQPYWDAVVHSLATVDKDPLRCLRKLQLLHQELLRLKKSDAELDFRKVTQDLGVKLGFINVDASASLRSLAIGLPNSLDDRLDDLQKNNFKKFLISFSGECFSESTSISNEANKEKSEKIATKFCEREIKYREVLRNKNNPFKLDIELPAKEIAAKWLKKVISTYDRTAGLPIEKLTEYIISNPVSAQHFLKRRSVGNRNFRKEFCRNPELIYSLINSGNTDILAAIESTKLLSSTHLSQQDREKLQKIFIDAKSKISTSTSIDQSNRDEALKALVQEMQKMGNPIEKEQRKRELCLIELSKLKPEGYKRNMLREFEKQKDRLAPDPQKMRDFVQDVNKAFATKEGFSGAQHWELIFKHGIHFGQAFSPRTIDGWLPEKSTATTPPTSPSASTKNISPKRP